MSLPRLLSTPRALVFAGAFLIFGLGLLHNLGVPDVENDEAIYNYAVERMIDTGDWLTPRDHPERLAFLEKPPLKFWLVAAPIETRAPAPHRRSASAPSTRCSAPSPSATSRCSATGSAASACAVASCLILFGLRDLVLAHGIRTNNMEASLVAAYAGGLYHFVRWREHGRRRDAMAVGAWFTLAFMTKFAAAAFMPLVALAACLVPQRPGPPKPLRAAIADWAWTAALAVGVSAPWFVYQYLVVRPRAGRDDVPAARLRPLHRRARFRASQAVGLTTS